MTSLYDIAAMRRNRDADTAQITAALKKTSQYEKDDADFFKVEKDKAGNGSAVIRFLPKHPDDDLPYVSIYSHAFQGPTGRWYIENSRTTLGEQDPVAIANAKLWKTGLDSDKEQAKKQKRRLHYVANVLVVSYPANPAIEGQILRFKYGKKIHEKMMEKANPTFPDEVPANPFDPFEGVNFKLRMRQVDGFPNYDTSQWSDPTPLAKTDEKMLEILNQVKPLKDLVAPSKFKSYDELQKKFDSVMNGEFASTKTAEDVADMLASAPVASAKSPGKVVEAPAPKAPAPVADDSDDIEDYFRSISEG